MKLRAGLVILFAIVLSGCSMSLPKSGIEIITYPTAKVYIDGKDAGSTPYKNNSLKPGEIEVKLVAKDIEWIKKIHLENGANTVINREFATTAETSGGYILYFEATGDKNKAGILISSKPDRATVAIEDEVKGYSPLRLEDVGEGDKKLVISFPGHKSVSSYVKFVKNYQLVVEADLPLEEVVETTEMVVPAPTDKVAMVMIKSTETGWLRVRNSADANGAEITRVFTNEKYPIVDEKADWYKINLGTGKSGWISAKYAEKLP
jgi:hypothetical protein